MKCLHERVALALALALALAGSGLGGCGADALIPIARFDIEPASLCEGAVDAEIRLDGSDSLEADGTAGDALTYAWTLVPPARRVIQGDLGSDVVVVVEVDAVAPVRVTLEITDASGSSAFKQRSVGLTRTTPTGCQVGCASHETCTLYDGALSCVDAFECVSNDECGPCLRCRADDAGVRHCAP